MKSAMWLDAMNVEEMLDRCEDPENDKSEIVSKETTPLPYIQVGMLLVCPDDDAKWWEVESIFETADLGGTEATVASLRSNDVRRVTVKCPELRTRWRLYADFDPTIERDVGVAGDRCEPGNECGRVGCPNCQD